MLQNQFVTHSDWVIQSGKEVGHKQIGPLDIYLQNEAEEISDAVKPEIILKPVDDNTLQYMMRDKNNNVIGKLKVGSSIQTPWMDMKLFVLKYIPNAVETFSYNPQKRPSLATTGSGPN